MSEPVITTDPEPTPEPAPAPSGSKMSLIHEEVEKALAESSDLTRKQVVDELVNVELASRKSLVMSAMNKLREMRNNLNKLRGQGNKAFDVDGKQVSETFSKEQLGEIKKAKEQLDKLDKALEDALSKGDFKKLKECKP